MGIRWTRRRLGYVVWGSAFVVVIVPELLAAIDAIEKHLPFPTISRTIGHLEAVNPVWEVFPTALIVLFVYALLTAPVPGRGGVRAPSVDDDEVPDEVHTFWWRALACVVLLVAATVAAAEIWPDQHLAADGRKLPNFYVAYVLWGTSFLIWVVQPTITAVRNGRHRFPSLPNTIVNLEQWLTSRFNRGVAFAVGFAIVWGMTFLLLHLTLYPFPDITRELNRTELVCNGQVVSRMPHDRDPGCRLDHDAGPGG